MKLEVSLPGVLTRELVEWIIHPLWASVFSSLKWRCWARWPHGPNMLCLGDKPSFSSFQPCSASPPTYSRIWQLLPNGYSEFSVLLHFNWKNNCPHPCYFCFSSWCYSKKKPKKRGREGVVEGGPIWLSQQTCCWIFFLALFLLARGFDLVGNGI